MNLPTNDTITELFIEEYSNETSSFEGSKEECDAIDEFLKKCPRFYLILLDAITHRSGSAHQICHMIFDAFKLGYQSKCKEIEEKELYKIHNAKD
jgi:hypothetical protein